MTSIRISHAQAADALRNAAVESADQMVGVLVFTSRGEILCKPQEVEDIIDDLKYAKLFAFEPGPFGHDLAVLLNGIIYRYDVPMPDPALIVSEEHARNRPDMRIRVKVRKRFLDMFRAAYTSEEATEVCNAIRAQRNLPPVDYPQWMMLAHRLGRTQEPMDIERFATGAMFVALGMTGEER